MQPGDTDYDPHLYRAELLSHPTNNYETLFHLIKGCLGTGVLAMPEAFMFAGMLNGIIGFLLISLFATYCVHVLVRSQYMLCKKVKVGLLIYSESVEVACDVGPEIFRGFKKIASALTDFFLIFYQTGTCCIYWVFFGTNLKYVMDVYTAKEYPLYIYMLALFIPHCIIMCVRNLKLMAPFSLLADIITFATFAVVFYYIFKNLDSKFSDRPSFGKVMDFPLFFGTVLFALQSIPVTISVENNMETPEFFRKPFGALNVGFLSLTILYVFVGVFGYWRYGEKIKSSITMNFPPEEILSQVIILSYCLAIFISYALNAYVTIHIIYDNYMMPRMESFSDNKKLCVEMLLRLFYVIITCFFATTIPLLGLIISLCGTFCLSSLGMIFPGLLEIAAYWQEGESKPNTFRFWKDIFIIIIGIVGVFSGLYSTFRSMYEKLSSGNY